MKCALFVTGQFAVQIGGEPCVDFVVNRCHTFSPSWREQAKLFTHGRERSSQDSGARH